MTARGYRRDYFYLWNKRHPGYKATDSRRRALLCPASRAFFREILGVRVRVNLIRLVRSPQTCHF